MTLENEKPPLAVLCRDLGSGGVATCRSALRDRERQLSIFANAYSVPFAVIRALGKRTFNV